MILGDPGTTSAAGPLKFIGRDACSAPLNVMFAFYETPVAMPYRSRMELR